MFEDNLGVQIPVCPPKFDDMTNTFNFNFKVQTAETVDDAIIAELYEIAKEEGITHLIVLDKANIKEALGKVSAKNVKSLNRRFHVCPNCDQVLLFTTKYCHECGQKLDWTGEYMD